MFIVRQMPNEDTELKTRVEHKLKELIDRYSQQKEQIKSLNEEISVLKERLEATNQEVAELRKERKNLMTALQISGESEGKTAAIEQINGIVREIDKCLALLNQ